MKFFDVWNFGFDLLGDFDFVVMRCGKGGFLMC